MNLTQYAAVLSDREKARMQIAGGIADHKSTILPDFFWVLIPLRP